MTTNKEKYRALCMAEPGIPIFCKDWWLDATAGNDNWDVAIIEENGQIIASLPYYRKKKAAIFEIITLPKLTQTMGIWIRYHANQDYGSRMAHEKKLITELISKLPRVDYFSQSFHYSFENWQPFYWKGYSQTTKYTAVIDDLTNLDNVFAAFNKNKRTDIRRAEKEVHVTTEDNLEEFYQLNKMVFDRQNIPIQYSFDYLKGIDQACARHDARKMFFARGTDGQLFSALYMIWDGCSAYLMMSGTDPQYRTVEAKTLLVWEAIKFASTVTKKFDFEGSMLEPVAQYNKGFGTVLKPYSVITKVDSKLLKLYLSVFR